MQDNYFETAATSKVEGVQLFDELFSGDKPKVNEGAQLIEELFSTKETTNGAGEQKIEDFFKF